MASALWIVCGLQVVLCYGLELKQLAPSSADLLSHIEQVFSVPRSHAAPDEGVGKQKAMRYINDFLSKLQDKDKRIDYSEKDFVSGKGVAGKNFVLVIPGERWGTPQDRITVIGSHFDTAPTTPGVEANGSGMSAFLEVSKRLVGAYTEGCTFLNSVILVAFDLEEEDEAGSTFFVDDYLVPEVLTKYNIMPETYQGAIIFDALMNYNTTAGTQNVPSGFQFLFGDIYTEFLENDMKGDFMTSMGRTPDIPVANRVRDGWRNVTSMYKASGDDKSRFWYITIPLPVNGRLDDSGIDLETPLFKSFAGFLGGDHLSFWNHASDYTTNGLPAVVFTDTGDLRGLMQNCFHKDCDNLVNFANETNLEFLSVASEAILKVILDGATETPDLHCLLPKPEYKNKEEQTSGSRCMAGYGIALMFFTLVFHICWL